MLPPAPPVPAARLVGGGGAQDMSSVEGAELSALKPRWPDSVSSQEQSHECCMAGYQISRHERMIREEEPRDFHAPLPRSRGRVIET